MNWEDRIRQSDAGRLNPERAEEIVKEAKKESSKMPEDWYMEAPLEGGSSW